MNRSQPLPAGGEPGALPLPLPLLLLLAGLGLAGLAGNLLLLAGLGQALRRGRGSPLHAALLHLGAADLLLALLCAPLRLAAARPRPGAPAAVLCRAGPWLLHAGLLARSLALAAVGRARLRQVAGPGGSGPGPGPGPLLLLLLWLPALALPLPLLLFGRLQPGPDGPRCLLRPPAAFGRLFAAAYPPLAALPPAAFAARCYWRILRARGPQPAPARPATRLLLGLCLLAHAAAAPEWGLWLWGRQGGARPPEALEGLAPAALLLPGALGPALLLAAWGELRAGLRPRRGGAGEGEDQGGGAPRGEAPVPVPAGKALPELQHFWQERGAAAEGDESDPLPWEHPGGP